MNIDQYREMVAQEANQANQEQQQLDSQGAEQPNVETQTHQETSTTATIPEQTKTDETNQGGTEGEIVQETSTNATPELPTTIEIDGKPVPIEELKNGYLRQSDYTKKTQELARQREQQELKDAYFNAINSRPELAQAVATQFNLPYVDPTQAQLIEAQNKLVDMELRQEVETLSSKYPDFEAREVLQFAMDNKLENLEHAYTLLSHQKGASTPADPIVETQATAPTTIDVEALKEQIRQDLLKDLQSNVDTQSIIQSGGDSAPVRDNTPTLTPTELKIARNMKISPEDYAKWRDKK